MVLFAGKCLLRLVFGVVAGWFFGFWGAFWVCFPAFAKKKFKLYFVDYQGVVFFRKTFFIEPLDNGLSRGIVRNPSNSPPLTAGCEKGGVVQGSRGPRGAAGGGGPKPG
jgi:hypothetical protein